MGKQEPCILEAYRRGQSAYKAGKPVAGNPYAARTRAFDYYNLGWVESAEADQELREKINEYL